MPKTRRPCHSLPGGFAYGDSFALPVAGRLVQDAGFADAQRKPEPVRALNVAVITLHDRRRAHDTAGRPRQQHASIHGRRPRTPTACRRTVGASTTIVAGTPNAGGVDDVACERLPHSLRHRAARGAASSAGRRQRRGASRAHRSRNASAGQRSTDRHAAARAAGHDERGGRASPSSINCRSSLPAGGRRESARPAAHSQA